MNEKNVIKLLKGIALSDHLGDVGETIEEFLREEYPYILEKWKEHDDHGIGVDGLYDSLKTFFKEIM